MAGAKAGRLKSLQITLPFSVVQVWNDLEVGQVVKLPATDQQDGDMSLHAQRDGSNNISLRFIHKGLAAVADAYAADVHIRKVSLSKLDSSSVPIQFAPKKPLLGTPSLISTGPGAAGGAGAGAGGGGGGGSEVEAGQGSSPPPLTTTTTTTPTPGSTKFHQGEQVDTSITPSGGGEDVERRSPAAISMQLPVQTTESATTVMSTVAPSVVVSHDLNNELIGQPRLAMDAGNAASRAPAPAQAHFQATLDTSRLKKEIKEEPDHANGSPGGSNNTRTNQNIEQESHVAGSEMQSGLSRQVANTLQEHNTTALVKIENRNSVQQGAGAGSDNGGSIDGHLEGSNNNLKRSHTAISDGEKGPANNTHQPHSGQNIPVLNGDGAAKEEMGIDERSRSAGLSATSSTMTGTGSGSLTGPSPAKKKRGPRQYKCDVCGAEFVYAGVYSKHMWKHNRYTCKRSPPLASSSSPSSTSVNHVQAQLSVSAAAPLPLSTMLSVAPTLQSVSSAGRCARTDVLKLLSQQQQQQQQQQHGLSTTSSCTTATVAATAIATTSVPLDMSSQSKMAASLLPAGTPRCIPKVPSNVSTPETTNTSFAGGSGSGGSADDEDMNDENMASYHKNSEKNSDGSGCDDETMLAGVGMGEDEAGALGSEDTLAEVHMEKRDSGSGSGGGYDCWICGRPFHYRPPFIRHMRGAHEVRVVFDETRASHKTGKVFTCKLCSHSFLYQLPFEKHMRLIHGTNLDAASARIVDVRDRRQRRHNPLLSSGNGEHSQTPLIPTLHNATSNGIPHLAPGLVTNDNRTYLAAVTTLASSVSGDSKFQPQITSNAASNTQQLLTNSSSHHHQMAMDASGVSNRSSPAMSPTQSPSSSSPPSPVPTSLSPTGNSPVCMSTSNGTLSYSNNSSGGKVSDVTAPYRDKDVAGRTSGISSVGTATAISSSVPKEGDYILIDSSGNHVMFGDKLQCFVCSQRFVDKRIYLVHMQNEHGIQPKEENSPFKAVGTKTGKVFNCHLCQRRFSYKGPYEKHMRSHGINLVVLEKEVTQESLYCEICGKVFAYQLPYEKHMRNSHGLGAQSGSNTTTSSASLTSGMSLLSSPNNGSAGRQNIMSTSAVAAAAAAAAVASNQADLYFRQDLRTQHQCDICLRNFASMQTLVKHVVNKHQSHLGVPDVSSGGSGSGNGLESVAGPFCYPEATLRPSTDNGSGSNVSGSGGSGGNRDASSVAEMRENGCEEHVAEELPQRVYLDPHSVLKDLSSILPPEDIEEDNDGESANNGDRDSNESSSDNSNANQRQDQFPVLPDSNDQPHQQEDKEDQEDDLSPATFNQHNPPGGAEDMSLEGEQKLRIVTEEEGRRVEPARVTQPGSALSMIRCEVCNKMFRYKIAFSKHVQLVHGGNMDLGVVTNSTNNNNNNNNNYNKLDLPNGTLEEDFPGSLMEQKKRGQEEGQEEGKRKQEEKEEEEDEEEEEEEEECVTHYKSSWKETLCDSSGDLEMPVDYSARSRKQPTSDGQKLVEAKLDTATACLGGSQ